MSAARRVRKAQCPDCGFPFKVQRRSKEDVSESLNVQTCTECYICIDGTLLPTFLEASDEVAGEQP